MDTIQVMGALTYLERRFGRTPSVEDIAEKANCSSATALKYLDKAVSAGLIAKRDGKFMTLSVSRAFTQTEEKELS